MPNITLGCENLHNSDDGAVIPEKGLPAWLIGAEEAMKAEVAMPCSASRRESRNQAQAS